MAAQLQYVVFRGKIDFKQSTGSSRCGLTTLFFLIEGQLQKLRPTKTCPVDFFPVANACARSGHQLFASASGCQVKRSLEFLHFIRPVFLERFVEFHWASGITCSEELWRERSSVASFAAALPCLWSSIRRPNEKFSDCFRILSQQYIFPAQLSGLISGSKTKMQRKKPPKGSLRDQGLVVTELPGFEELFLFLFS